MRICLLFFLLLINRLSLHSDETINPFSLYNYSFLTEDNGLPNNFVDDIFKDSKGYIWISTHSGLARYDGYTFVTFTSSTVPVTLKSNFIHKVCEDDFNRLWVVSEGGIDVIDLNQYTNVYFPFAKYSPLWELMHSYASSIYKDSKGNLWISSEKNLYCLELNKDGYISDYFCLEEEQSKSPVESVIDVGWAVCAGINNAVQRIDKRKNHILKAEPVSQLVTAKYDDWKIQCMETDGELLWIGTNRGLFKYNHFEQEIERFRYSSSKPGYLSQSHITDIRRDKNGKLFVSTLNGLNVYNREKNTFSFIRQNNDYKTNSLNCNFINCLLQDGNNIWVGTEIGGVNLLAPGRLVTNSWQHDRTDATSLSPNPVNAIFEDKKGNLWVGTVEGGLNLKRKGKNSFEHIVSDPKDPHSLSHNSVCGVLLDSDNQLWVYTWGLGVNKLDLNIPGNRKFERYYRGNTEGMEANFVASACEDTINRGIWFGTTEGLHFYDKQKQTFMQVELGVTDNKFDTMATLFMDNKNRLWAGTSKGLFIIDIFSFARSHMHFDYTYIKSKLSDPDSPTADRINCVYQDKEGTIWIGSNGNGLYKLLSDDGGDFKFRNYTVNNGLPNNNIIGIIEDSEGYLWLSTNQGISKLDKNYMAFNNFTKYDGLLTNQFYWNAYHFSASQNLLYFGNIEGLVAIHPGIQDNHPYITRVSLTGLSIAGNAIYPSSGDYLRSHISYAKHIYMRESDKTFTIDFSTKEYGDNNQRRYAYRLRGYEKEWNETRVGEHAAKYTSVPPGKYLFQVRATDSRGNWSEETTEIEIHITPYFYKSWWFLSLSVLLIAIAIYCFYKWKTDTLRRQKEILEKTVRERTSELAIQNKQIVSMSRKLANSTEEKISFFTNITHEFRTPVTLINGPLEQALKYSKDPHVTEQIRMAERNSRYLLTLVNELMDFRKLDDNKVKLDKKSGNLKTFIDQILISFQAFARDRQITLEAYSRLDTPYLVLDYEYMRKVIINLLSNAIKFTPDSGKIRIYTAALTGSDGQKYLYICVQDSGGGIVEDDLERIFDRFYQSPKSRKYPAQGQNSTGIGLFLCKKIIRLHGGKIKAGNNKNKGSSFKIMMPYVAGEATEETIAEIKTDVLQIEPSASDGIGETILVVDDNADMRTYIRSLLLPTYQVLEAQDGAEALALIQSKPIDLILSDLMMPVMDGMELSRRVKENLSVSHIPFLILTALVSEEQKKMSYEIGVDEYLCKPFDEDILLLRIRNIFTLRNQYKSRFAISMNCDVLPVNEESRDKKFVSAAISLMKEHYADSTYEVDSFVRDMNYSKTMVNRKLQDLIGQSIGQFMRNYRLNIAHEMLMHAPAGAGINVSEVAYSVGFNDPKYFTRCFKDFFGILPSTLLTKK